MKRQSLTLLSVVALLAAVLAVWLTSERQAVSETGERPALIEGLDQRLNDVTRVRIESATGNVTLDRGESEWTVAERGGFPANLQNLRKKLMAYADSELMEPKTQNPDNYPMIGVEEIDAPEAKSVRVTLDGLANPISLIVGNQNYRGDPSTYVRRAGEAESWLASGDLKMDAEVAGWLRKDVINVSSVRVSRVTLSHPGETLRLVKTTAGDPNFLVMDLPPGRELSSPGAGNTVAGALGSLRLEDVRPVSEVDLERVVAVEGVFETFDGLRIRTRAWEIDDAHFVHLEVEFDAALVPVVEQSPADRGETQEAAQEVDNTLTDTDTDTDTEGQDGDQSAVALSQDASATDQSAQEEAPDVSAEAANMAAVVEGWVFEIPDYKYKNLSKRLDDLLKPLPSDPTE